jgi:inhibitor of cysteine peptidase
MKLKLIPILVAIISLTSFMACSQKQVSLEISYEDLIKDKHLTWATSVDVDDIVVVILGSNPTTGFSWPDIAQISDSGVLKQTEHQFIPPGQTGVVGASGKDTWSFKAIKNGTTTILMDYVRPWESERESEWTFSATITVE